jgi:tRNA-Thr(GGU) m(6)t(6)A37 methyltransferase TsaA
MSERLTLSPIGIIRTPFPDRVSAPRQAPASSGAAGTIELFPGRDFEHALSDLEGWEYIWVIFWFHLNTGWRPKVLPPRSGRKRRGLFSTRSPHRPNPIGMSVVKLEEVRGLSIHVRNVDMIDGTPVLDIKPYVPYADAFPNAQTGWLKPLAFEEGGRGEGATGEGATGEGATGEGSAEEGSAGALGSGGQPARPEDPEPGFEVVWSELAAEQARYLREAHGIDLVAPVNRTLSLGPQPHPYRRIRKDGDAMRLAVKDWRVRFRTKGRAITVELITTGYRARDLASSEDPAVAVHRTFLERYV